MKTLANLLILVAVLAGFAIAQSGNSITNWVPLERAEDEFSLETPEGFEYRKLRFLQNKIDARGEFHSDGEWFFLFIDVPKDPYNRRKAEAFLDFSKHTASNFDLSGQDAEKAEFEDSTGFYHRMVFTQTANRVFTLHTVSRQKNSKEAVRFLNSFKLNPSAVADSPVAEPIFAIDPNGSADLTPAPAQPPGVASKASPMGSATLSPTAQNIAPLRIPYKEKAQYTDFARYYNIRGTVTLRVTFLAKGEIGSVVTIRALPFGLTESAVHAAKQMRFEPETVVGVPRTTTRPVAFTFHIY